MDELTMLDYFGDAVSRGVYDPETYALRQMELDDDMVKADIINLHNEPQPLQFGA